MIGPPSQQASAPRSQPCAAGIVFDGAGRLLMVRRARPPSQGSWSIPGGKCHPGESAAQACVREVAEETGLDVLVQRWAGQVERAGPAGVRYVIDDFVCRVADGRVADSRVADSRVADSRVADSRVAGGRLRAGDDASEVRWVTATELGHLDVVPGLVTALASWDLIPQ